MQPHSLYLHVPFCRHRCAYCDFNTYAGLNDLMPAYTRALCREIELAAEAAGTRLPVHTVFFGGGTPSLLPAADLAALLATIQARFALLPEAEITLEANPGTVSLPYLHELRTLGINRLSLGMQSASLEDLRVLEREHGPVDVARAVGWARRAGFANLNLDLIFGLPGQTLSRWQDTLRWARRLGPEHFSLYALLLEHGTPMSRWAERGLLALPEDDLVADMYEGAIAFMAAEGFEQYEISNFACRDSTGRSFACRHNLQYWYNRPYLGLGAGAHGFAGGYRTANVRGPQAYVARCLTGAPRPFPRTPATSNAHPVDRATEMGETMMMGLRLVAEGVSEADFRARFGVGIAGAFPEAVGELGALGLVEWAGAGEGLRLRLTERGKMLGNQVFMRFV